MNFPQNIKTFFFVILEQKMYHKFCTQKCFIIPIYQCNNNVCKAQYIVKIYLYHNKTVIEYAQSTEFFLPFFNPVNYIYLIWFCAVC